MIYDIWKALFSFARQPTQIEVADTIEFNLEETP